MKNFLCTVVLYILVIIIIVIIVVNYYCLPIFSLYYIISNNCTTSLPSYYQVEKKLAGRLQAGIQAWTSALQGQRQKDEDIDIPMDTDTPDKPTHKPGGEPKV